MPEIAIITCAHLSIKTTKEEEEVVEKKKQREGRNKPIRLDESRRTKETFFSSDFSYFANV